MPLGSTAERSALPAGGEQTPNPGPSAPLPPAAV